MTGRKRIFIVVSMIICGIAAAVVYGMFDPAESAFFPKCPFLLLTGGLRCPGCGSQRAIHSLLHLEFKEAFLYNPLVIISIPFLILLAAAALVKESRPGFYNKVNSSLLSKTLLVIIIVWWIVRNIIGL
ncbi:MAG: DUF2752 domain-containing protein [Bacteroidales bacterium]|nr:DUF2752 domain-containing protein [Bacteroidales bacterium]